MPQINPHTNALVVGVNLNKSQIFSLFGFFWIGLGFLALILELSGFFFKSIIVAYFFIAGHFLIFLIAFNKTKTRLSRNAFCILIISLSAVFVFSYFSSPTIFSGRDQGTLSGTAIQLAQNHRLGISFPAENEFFKIYGPGTALNFPGFNYNAGGELVPHFPLGFIAWLAAFYSVLGLKGLVVANGVSFLLFIFSFYALSRHYLKFAPALVSVLFVLSSFVFAWFFKFTLSENLALALIWFSIYQFILFFGKKERLYLAAALMSMGLLCFTRIEGLAFFAIMLIILFYKQKDWKKLFFGMPGKIGLLALTGAVLLYFLTLRVNSAFYVSLAKALIKPFLEIRNNSIDVSELSIFFVFNVFVNYALFGFVVLGLLGAFYIFKNKRKELLLPLLVVSPAFLYVLLPNISNDHPWMLRRFIFAVVPVSIFYTSWFLDNFFKKKIYFYAVSAVLLLSNLFVFFQYLNFVPNQNLLSQVKPIADKFTGNDLILVDRWATGDPWSMLTGPMNFLYQKQAVYFFNPYDLQKIDAGKFDHIYLIIPDSSIEFYEKSGLLGRLEAKERYTIENTMLAVTARKSSGNFLTFRLPEKNKIKVSGKIYLFKNQ